MPALRKTGAYTLRGAVEFFNMPDEDVKNLFVYGLRGVAPEAVTPQVLADWIRHYVKTGKLP